MLFLCLNLCQQAFQAQCLNPDTAHTALPIKMGQEVQQPAKKKAKLTKQPHALDLVVIPDIPRVVSEIHQIGLGLVSDVVLRLCPEP